MTTTVKSPGDKMWGRHTALGHCRPSDSWNRTDMSLLRMRLTVTTTAANRVMDWLSGEVLINIVALCYVGPG